MKTSTEEIEYADYMIRQLQKIESRIKVGEWFYALRDILRLQKEHDNRKRQLLQQLEEKLEQKKEE